MRVTQEYKGLGEFWLPSDPENKIFGNLLISDGGKVQLELCEPFDPDPRKLSWFSRDSGEIDRINGYLEDGRYVTLESCLHREQSLRSNNRGTSVVKSIIDVDLALINVQYEKDQRITFNTLFFSVEGLDKWLGTKFIEKFDDLKNMLYGIGNKNEIKSTTITCNKLETPIYELSNGFKLSILPQFATSLSPLMITQKTYFKLQIDTAQELSKFIDIAQRLTTFICFVIDQIVSLKEVSAASDALVQELGRGKTYRVDLYYRSFPFVQEKPDLKRIDRGIFGFDEERFGKIIDKWISAYEPMPAALNLYFSARAEAHKHLDGKFLALVQGLECFIKREYPGEDLKSREYLKRFIKPFDSHLGNSEKQRDELIEKIRNKRNDLTHPSENPQGKIVYGQEFVSLYYKVEALFQLNFMKLIGFSHEEITLALSRCYRLRQRIEFE